MLVEPDPVVEEVVEALSDASRAPDLDDESTTDEPSVVESVGPEKEVVVEPEATVPDTLDLCVVKTSEGTAVEVSCTPDKEVEDEDVEDADGSSDIGDFVLLVSLSSELYVVFVETHSPVWSS